MRRSLFVVVALAALLALIAVLCTSGWRGWSGSERGAGVETPQAVSGETAVRRRVDAPQSEPAAASQPPSLTVAPTPDAVDDRRLISLNGIVLDADGTPARAGLHVMVSRHEDGATIGTARTAEGGWWTFEARLPLHVQIVGVTAFDGETVRVSAQTSLDLWRSHERAFVVLRLRPTVSVTGRIVDAAGVPVAGADVRVQADRRVGMVSTVSSQFDAEAVVAELTSGRDGRFTVARLRTPSDTVRAWVVEAGGVRGREVVAQLAGRSSVDLGDVPAVGDALARWTVHVRDHEGRAAVGATLRFVGQGHAYAEQHPSYDEERVGLVVGTEGVVSLAFACRGEPVVLAIGGGLFAPRQFAMDRAVPGEHRADVVLARRASVTVHVRGVPHGVRAQEEAWLDVRGSASDRSADLPGTVDIRTGEPSSASQGPYAAPIEMIDARGVPWARWTGDDTIEVASAAPTELDLAVQLAGVEICAGRVATTDPPGSQELSVAPGMLVRLDLGPLRDWMRAVEPHPWLPRLAVWPHRGDAAVSADGRVAGPSDVSGHIELRDSAGVREDDCAIWMPGGVTQLALGTLVRGRMHALSVVSLDAVLEPESSGSVVVVPAPVRTAALLATLRVQVRSESEPLARAGIPVQISARSEIAFGEGRSAFTDARGVATFRVIPGSYVAAVSGDVAARDAHVATWQSARLDAPGAQAEVAVDLVWPAD